MGFPQYATEQDFQRYATDAIPYVNPLRRVLEWVTHDTNVYKAYQVGGAQVCFVNGADWGAAESSLGNVNGATKWFHDAASDTLYIYYTFFFYLFIAMIYIY